jgi:hypothetical protein
MEDEFLPCIVMRHGILSPSDKKIVGCHRAYTIKYQPDGTIDHLNARLVANSYTFEGEC